MLKQIQLLELGPVALIPKGFLLQPIDVGEVADRLVELALSAPAGRVPDAGGPEIMTFADLARSYQKVAGREVGRGPRARQDGARLSRGSADVPGEEVR
jgi:uncharacterized protein YbjT (DUF2867 family)